MYYLNCFFIYSIFGYILETIISLITKSGFKSGVLTGFWTPVYGVGAITILFVSNYLFKNLHMPRIIETLIMFLVIGVILSFLEAVGGVLIEKIFGQVFWDYSSHKYHIGHYISLEMTLIWSIASIIFVYIIHPLLKGLIKKIPTWVTFILIALFIVDLIKTYVSKKLVNGNGKKYF